MKRLLSLLMLLLLITTANAKCDWSKVSLGKSNKCNAYNFEVIGTADTCNKHNIKIIKKGSTTTSYDGTSRTFNYTFTDTGYYYIRISVKNSCCGGGDTLFYVPLHITCKPKCDWSKVGFYYSNKCGVVIFEMGSYIDSCIQYTTWRYNHKTGRLDTIAHDRVFTRTMDTGTYSFKTSFHNKCNGCDTFIYKQNIHIDCKISGIIDTTIPEPKLIGMYDILGRPIINIRKEEIIIYLYDNGTTKKVLIQ